jgi:uncharacterized protein
VNGVSYDVDDLDEATCWRLLGTVPVGRLASTDAGLPKILPVHFTVRGDEVVIANFHGARFMRAEPGDVVAFEVDSYDPGTHDGWYVGVVGSCRAVTDEDEIAELDASSISPWRSSDGGRYLAVQVVRLFGRAVTRRHDEVRVHQRLRS